MEEWRKRDERLQLFLLFPPVRALTKCLIALEKLQKCLSSSGKGTRSKFRSFAATFSLHDRKRGNTAQVLSLSRSRSLFLKTRRRPLPYFSLAKSLEEQSNTNSNLRTPRAILTCPGQKLFNRCKSECVGRTGSHHGTFSSCLDILFAKQRKSNESLRATENWQTIFGGKIERRRNEKIERQANFCNYFQIRARLELTTLELWLGG